MNTLDQLAKFYCTDKRSNEHDYVQFYEFYFSRVKHSRISLLEIGILEHPDKINRPFGAASLRMWADYFPNAEIHGIDISDLRHNQSDRIKIYVCDQGDNEKLINIFESNNLRPNIIIDDGSHKINHQQSTLATIFKYLAPGGIYVIEDIVQFNLKRNLEAQLLVSRAEFHDNKEGIPLGFTSFNRSMEELQWTTISMLMDFCINKKINSPFMSPDEASYLEDHIDFCNIHPSKIFNMHIAFLRKKL